MSNVGGFNFKFVLQQWQYAQECNSSFRFVGLIPGTLAPSLSFCIISSFLFLQKTLSLFLLLLLQEFCTKFPEVNDFCVKYLAWFLFSWPDHNLISYSMQEFKRKRKKKSMHTFTSYYILPTKIQLLWIKELNVKAKLLTSQKENVGQYFLNLRQKRSS